tara:strand:- start:2065 stop:2292 length:228 start_codon:yes stop_codon:yes gene_type:complete
MLGLMQSLAKSAFVKLIPAAAWKYLTASLYEWDNQNMVNWEDYSSLEGSWVWIGNRGWQVIENTNWEDWISRTND